MEISDMILAKYALSPLAIAISTTLFTPISLAVSPPTDINSTVIINSDEEIKLIASEGYAPEWEHFDTLNVGQNSNGSLLIDNLSLITSSASIGNNAEGTITLKNHTHWQFDTPNSIMVLGTNEGSGTVYVLEGSKISDLRSMRIGEFYGDAMGALFIDGENSSVTSNIAIIGDQGTGKVSVTNGGTLTSLTQMNIGYVNAHSTLSANQSSYGEVQVTGKNSTVNAPCILLAGYKTSSTSDATGYLTVSNNAVINANSYISVGVSANGTGILNIGGAQGEAAQPAGSINTPLIHLGGTNASTTSILNFNHTSADFVLASLIGGKGQVNQVGSGTTTLSGMNNYAGDTYITKGSLRAGQDNTFSPNSDYIVDSGGHLDLNGYSQTLNTLTLAGTATLSSSDNDRKFAPTTLTINGNYTASDALLVMHTVLGDDNSATDKLIVKGDTSGSTRVMINNAGGLGADTLEGIKIVEVEGLSEGVFIKEGRIVAGPYDYNVTKSDNQNWFLTSEIPADPYTPPELPVIPQPPVDPEPPVTPVTPEPPVPPSVPPEAPQPERKHQYRPELGSYLANIQAANTLFTTRLHDRLGETQYTDPFTGEQKATSLWMRNIGGHNRFKDHSGELNTQSNRYVLQLGGDIAQWSSNALDRWHIGLMAGYANSKSHTHSNLTGYNSRSQINGYSVGVYGTWYANEADKTGTYVDSWLLYNWFDNSVSGEYLSSEQYHSDGITAAIEAGYTFHLGKSTDTRTSYWLQPKMQLTWMDVKADNHTEDNGTLVEDSTNGNLQTRLGVKAYLQSHNALDDHKERSFQPFVEANWIYNSRNYSVKMDRISDEIIGARNTGELKVGVEGQLNPHLQLWGNVAQQLGDNGYSDT